MTRSRAVWLGLAGLFAVAIPLLASETARDLAAYAVGRLEGRATVSDRVVEFGPVVQGRLQGAFEQAGLAYPPGEVALLAFKDVRHLEVYARAHRADDWRFIKDYRVPTIAAPWLRQLYLDLRTELQQYRPHAMGGSGG